MSANNGNGKDGDEFVIVGVFGDRKKMQSDLNGLWPECEVVAPVERRMIRPRRKSSNGEGFWIERPLFFEYVAVKIVGEWQAMKAFDWFGFLMMNDDQPVSVPRQALEGMLVQSKERSWEGAEVEVVSGAMKGQRGIYSKGRVSFDMLGRRVKARVSVFELSMV
jgi:transcription antitermination factor NusG